MTDSIKCYISQCTLNMLEIVRAVMVFSGSHTAANPENTVMQLALGKEGQCQVLQSGLVCIGSVLM